MPGFFVGKGVGVGFGVGCGFGVGWGFGGISKGGVLTGTGEPVTRQQTHCAAQRCCNHAGAPLYRYGLGIGGGCGVGFGLGWGMGVGWGSKLIEPQVFPAKPEPSDFLHAAQHALEVLRDDAQPRSAIQAAGGGAVAKSKAS